MVCGFCGVELEGRRKRWCGERCRVRARRAAADEATALVLDAGVVGPNRRAAEATVEALRDLGRLEVVDEAQVTAFLELASAVDSKPVDAGLWREYRAAEAALRKVGTSGDLGAFEQFSHFLNDDSDAPVRHAAEG